MVVSCGEHIPGVKESRLTVPLFRQAAQEPLHLLRGLCSYFPSRNSPHLVVLDVDQGFNHELCTRAKRFVASQLELCGADHRISDSRHLGFLSRRFLLHELNDILQ